MFKSKRRDSNLVSSLMMFWKKLMHLMTGRHWPGSVSDCDVEQKLCTNCPRDAEISVTISVATNKSFILFHKLSRTRSSLMSKLSQTQKTDSTKLQTFDFSWTRCDEADDDSDTEQQKPFFSTSNFRRNVHKFDGRVDARKFSVRFKTYFLKIKTHNLIRDPNSDVQRFSVILVFI